MISKLRDFDTFVLRGLKHLFGKELGVNYEPLLTINEELLGKED